MPGNGLVPSSIAGNAMNFELAQSLYRDSMERRDQLNSESHQLIALGALLVGAAFYEVTEIDFASAPSTKTFISTLMLLGIFLFYAGYHLVRSQLGHKIGLMVSPRAQLDYYRSIDTTNSSTEAPTRDGIFRDGMLERYIEAAELNSKTNFQKERRLHSARRGLILSVVVAIPMSVAWQFNMRLPEQHSGVTSLSSADNTTDQDMSKQSGKPNPPPKTPPAPPKDVNVPPPITIITEGQDPDKATKK